MENNIEAEVAPKLDPKAFIASLDPAALLELKEMLGVRAPRAKKPVSPEHQAALDALAAIETENPEVIQRYKDAMENVRATKAVRKVLSTRKFAFDIVTGQITCQKTDELITTYDTEGWQSAMRAASYTVGQIAAVSKAARKAAKDLAA